MLAWFLESFPCWPNICSISGQFLLLVIAAVRLLKFIWWLIFVTWLWVSFDDFGFCSVNLGFAWWMWLCLGASRFCQVTMGFVCRLWVLFVDCGSSLMTGFCVVTVGLVWWLWPGVVTVGFVCRLWVLFLDCGPCVVTVGLVWWLWVLCGECGSCVVYLGFFWGSLTVCFAPRCDIDIQYFYCFDYLAFYFPTLVFALLSPNSLCCSLVSSPVSVILWTAGWTK